MNQTLPVHRPELWDAGAEKYELSFHDFTARYAEDALRLSDLRAGHRILDIAAGTGALSLVAARQGAEVTAIDFAPAMAERLSARARREEIDGVTVAVMDGQQLEFPDETFDRAYSVFGLMFFPSRERGLAEMRRVLKPGGKGGLVCWGALERVSIANRFRQAIDDGAPHLPPAPPPPWKSMLDPVGLAGAMEAAGFREVTVKSVVQEWVVQTPELAWEFVGATSPVCTMLLAKLDEASRNRSREAFVGSLREEFGDGPCRLPCEAHIAIGVK